LQGEIQLNLVDLGWLAMGAPDGTGEGGEAAAGGGFGLMLPVMLVGLVLVFWMMSRRNKKQQGKTDDFRNNLTVGTRVMTLGGMIGVISAINGDVITLKSPSGDETAYTKRAIREAVTDDMWAAMIEPPSIEDEVYPEDEPTVDDQPGTDQPMAGESEDPTK